MELIVREANTVPNTTIPPTELVPVKGPRTPPNTLGRLRDTIPIKSIQRRYGRFSLFLSHNENTPDTWV